VAPAGSGGSGVVGAGELAGDDAEEPGGGGRTAADVGASLTETGRLVGDGRMPTGDATCAVDADLPHRVAALSEEADGTVAQQCRACCKATRPRGLPAGSKAVKLTI